VGEDGGTPPSRSLSTTSESVLSRFPTLSITPSLSTDGRHLSTLPTPDSDPLGLHLAVNVPNPAGDIVFIHGLGGSAWKTWSWKRDKRNFWPAWLAEEEGLSSFRIFTFGYNSGWKGAATNLNISDFAKDLLLNLLTFSEKQPIGITKIIFVAHSMGGLVAKKAILLGKQDPQYIAMVSKVVGIIFLACPHRGAQHAATLNNILASTPLGPPPKAYVADLQFQSLALQDINEQFRHYCGGLSLVSFFETLKTNIGVSKTMVRLSTNPSA
jgi:pimeloyl-ACP methyl ester carboxylesterase